MSLLSFDFLLFTGAVFALYYLLPLQYQRTVILAASLVFYAGYGWEKTFFILLSCFIAWLAGKKMGSIYARQAEYAEEKKEAAQLAKKKAKSVQRLATLFLLFLLLYTKIGQWVIDMLSALISGKKSAFSVCSVLGISYYSFSLIGYLADVYWRKESPEQSFWRLLSFTAYFPKVLQGPIARHKLLAPQLAAEHPFDYRSFTFGLQRMCWGYFKKLVIADRLLIFVNTVFAMDTPAGLYVLTAAVFSAFQIYCDFSGCMDIALGLSEALGITLEENFSQPFFSRSAGEFWRRWHSTLGAWFKDYVYMPLVVSPRVMGLAKRFRNRWGARAGKIILLLLPTFSVWILTGLWHATGTPYLVWGLMWATLISLSTIFEPERKKLAEVFHINKDNAVWKGFETVRTFLLFCLGRLITGPGDLRRTGLLLRRIVTDFRPWTLFDQSLFGLGIDRPNFYLSLVCLLLLRFIDAQKEKGSSPREIIAGTNVVFRWFIYYALFFAILIFGIYGPGYDASSFVYANY